jgi:WD repeat-containing protein 76
VWDSRKLQTFAYTTGPHEISHEAVEDFVESKSGTGTVRAEFAHGKSVSSAYWDPRGRGIVSTSYDDTIRCG